MRKSLKSLIGVRLSTLAVLAACAWMAAMMLPLRSTGLRPVSGDDDVQPVWPYCAPDASPPPPPATPWPTLPPDAGDSRTEVGVLADLLVIAMAILPVGEPDGPMQQAEVIVDELVWETAFRSEDLGLEGLLPDELPMLVMGEREVWVEAGEALSGGGRVLLGLLVNRGGATDFSLVFAMDADPAAPAFFGPPPYADRDTGQFRPSCQHDVRHLPRRN